MTRVSRELIDAISDGADGDRQEGSQVTSLWLVSLGGIARRLPALRASDACCTVGPAELSHPSEYTVSTQSMPGQNTVNARSECGRSALELIVYQVVYESEAKMRTKYLWRTRCYIIAIL